jgi:hypothetical protein
MHDQHGSLRYPIGQFLSPVTVSVNERLSAIGTLAEAPAALRRAVAGLDEAQLATPYREGGWTVRQVVHHVGDSHVNAFVRMRLALTEEWPTIRPYDEAAWALLEDYAAPVEESLQLIERLHARWVRMLESLTEEQWQRGYVHPENGRTHMDVAALSYAWHSRHHTAQITRLRTAKGW